jgi:hypothetical protein
VSAYQLLHWLKPTAFVQISNQMAAIASFTAINQVNNRELAASVANLS